jgi:hypothetical protein
VLDPDFVVHLRLDFSKMLARIESNKEPSSLADHKVAGRTQPLLQTLPATWKF